MAHPIPPLWALESIQIPAKGYQPTIIERYACELCGERWASMRSTEEMEECDHFLATGCRGRVVAKPFNPRPPQNPGIGPSTIKRPERVPLGPIPARLITG